MVVDYNKMSDKELDENLKFLKRVVVSRKNSQWYYLYNTDRDERVEGLLEDDAIDNSFINTDYPPSFYFVKRKFWEKKGYIDDEHLDENPELVVPDGFMEAKEACFEYENNNRAEAQEVLEEHGFREAPEKFKKF